MTSRPADPSARQTWNSTKPLRFSGCRSTRPEIALACNRARPSTRHPSELLVLIGQFAALDPPVLRRPVDPGGEVAPVPDGERALPGMWARPENLPPSFTDRVARLKDSLVAVGSAGFDDDDDLPAVHRIGDEPRLLIHGQLAQNVGDGDEVRGRLRPGALDGPGEAGAAGALPPVRTRRAARPSRNASSAWSSTVIVWSEAKVPAAAHAAAPVPPPRSSGLAGASPVSDTVASTRASAAWVAGIR